VPRTSAVKPTRRNERAQKGLAAWCVNVPPELSDTGKRQQLFFATKSDAAGECEKLKARRDNFGISLSAMTPARIAEAAESYKLLDARQPGVSLLSIVRQYFAIEDRRTQSVSLAALFDEYVAAKSHRTQKYLGELNKARKPLQSLLSVQVCDLEAPELDKALSTISPGNRNAMMRYLRALFNHGIKRGYLNDNPVARLDFAHRPRREVETVPYPIVSGMLNHALEQDLELIPFLVLGFFCGIRPDGELQKILWSDIDLVDRVVTISSDVSKTKRKRFIDLSENALAWLSEHHERGGSTTEKIVPFSPNILRKKRRVNWKAAAGEKARWIPQGMRHTFCSNWLAVHGDINKLVLQSGHTDPDTMWKHYHRGTKKAEAEKFWSIFPTKTDAKIIAFASA
jgi:integrase